MFKSRNAFLLLCMWVHRNLFWQLARDGNLHGSGMSHATTTSPKPSFRAPWSVGDAVASTGNAGWTTSKSGHPCPCQNCSQGPPAEKTGRDLCWIVPHVPLVTQSVNQSIKRFSNKSDTYQSASNETIFQGTLEGG